MLAHYSHVRVEAKRKALDPLAVGVKTVGYDTKNDTRRLEGAILSSRALERIGGDDGTRTRGLCRDRELRVRNYLKAKSADGSLSGPKTPSETLIEPLTNLR
jgi:hypothetical protein